MTQVERGIATKAGIGTIHILKEILTWWFKRRDCCRRYWSVTASRKFFGLLRGKRGKDVIMRLKRGSSWTPPAYQASCWWRWYQPGREPISSTTSASFHCWNLIERELINLCTQISTWDNEPWPRVTTQESDLRLKQKNEVSKWKLGQSQTSRM